MLEIVPLPAFQDNYIWLLRRGASAAVVDPGDAGPVLDYLRREKLSLAAILVTHHHPDHVGGIAALLAEHPAPVTGPKGEPIPTLTRTVSGGDKVEVPALGTAFTVLDIPGHTRAHIAYYGPGVLLCGDTLFACGCGRVFEGTPAQMHASLGRLAALPGDTKVYCAHEYTLSNIRFARAVEPGNAALAARSVEAQRLRDASQPTLPSTIAAELATNPFLRCGESEVAASASRFLGRPVSAPVDVFTAIREWKNGF